MNDDIRKYVNALLEKHKDIHTVYALVCNAIDPINPKEADLQTKQYLEHLLAIEVMEEYSWERDEFGRWCYSL